MAKKAKKEEVAQSKAEQEALQKSERLEAGLERTTVLDLTTLKENEMLETKLIKLEDGSVVDPEAEEKESIKADKNAQKQAKIDAKKAAKLSKKEAKKGPKNQKENAEKASKK